MVSGNMNAFEIEALMDEEIETYEQESEVPAGSPAMVGDSPAFGIVAAVMGWCTPGFGRSAGCGTGRADR